MSLCAHRRPAPSARQSRGYRLPPVRALLVIPSLIPSLSSLFWLLHVSLPQPRSNETVTVGM